MEPQSIVCSLEWAKKLKETGYLWSECLFIRVGSMLDDNGIPTVWTLKMRDKWDFENFDPDILPCPTAEEILRRLPFYVEQDGVGARLLIQPHYTKDRIWWDVGYEKNSGTMFDEPSETLINAAAAMYCRLSENGLLPKVAI